MNCNVFRLICLAMVACAPTYLSSDEPVDFNREIRPLLSDRCFVCHGPDQATNDSGVRLDEESAALDAEVWVPGEPESSSLIARIESEDASLQMPPPESHLTLSNEEKALLRQWVLEGARYDAHWSFKSLPESVAVPPDPTGWATHDIDRFVAAALNRVQLSPTKDSERWRWLRRVTFDLTGLPPTAAEITLFENDPSERAYERVVDRLLASPHFGERVAVEWLDVVRYADSYGYQSDLLSPTWPYRDWVVHAFNQNMPYDQFLTEQLAGDLLPAASRSQKLATAFNRLHRQTNEGGSVNLEWRTEYVSDRVNTFGTAMLGLTLECARCHDHKFDPISQRDYFNLFSFFNNIDEWGMYNDSHHVPTPSLLLPTAAEDSAIADLEKKWSALNQQIAIRRESLLESPFKDWLRGQPKLEQQAAGMHWPLDARGPKNKLKNNVAEQSPGSSSAANGFVDGRFGQALLFSGDDPANFPLDHGLSPSNRFGISLWLKIPKGLTEAVILHRQSGTDVGFFGTELSLRNGRLFFAQIRFWPGNALAIETTDSLPTDQWVHVAVSNHASGDANGLSLIVNGIEKNRIVRNRLTKDPGAGGTGFAVGQKFRSLGLKGGAVDDLRCYEQPISQVHAQMLYQSTATATAADYDTEMLREHFLLHHDEFSPLLKERAKLVGQLLQAKTPVTEVMVMEEMHPARDAYVLHRGEYDAPRTEDNRAHRETPDFLPPMDSDLPRNRLGLARWLVSDDHPLTARVAVNRCWQMFFHTGLVASAADFGFQGESPTHPELLDWLARDFVDHGWDIKRLCKQIVLSATYRQSSRCTPELRRDDPDNRHLARGPDGRLSAEMIRDLALITSGLLNDRQGGPPVSPYQPANLWRENNSMTPAYRQSVDQGLYCRSLYSVWKRTAPLPNMLNFDAPTREVCTVKRGRTNTPLQALVLLNDIQFVEASRVLAARALQQHDRFDGRVSFMFVALTGRQPRKEELNVLETTFQQQLAFFRGDDQQAEKVLAIGSEEAGVVDDAAELAAMTVVAQTILNCDAAIWKR